MAFNRAEVSQLLPSAAIESTPPEGAPKAAPSTSGVGASAAGFKGMIVGIIVLVATIVCSAVLHHRAMTALKAEVQDKLVRAAMAVAIEVDGDLHQTFVDRAQEGTPEYERALAPLRRALYWKKNGRDVRNDYGFIYTCIQKGEDVFFVLDPTPAGVKSPSGVEQKSHVMQPYPDASETLRKVLRTGEAAADPEPYADEWGVFVSGYAPFFDSAGAMGGVVGVDWRAETYAKRLAGIQRAWYLQIVLCLASGFLSGIGTGIALVRRERIEAARRHAIEEARRNRERWRIMVETLPKPAAHVQDGDVWMNGPLQQALGYSRKEIRTMPDWFEKLFGARADEVRTIYAEERAAGFNRTRETKVRRKDGEERWFEFTAHSYGAGEVWLAEDITERRDYEAGIIAAREQAEAAVKAKSAFLATVSHEIRTPMNGVIGMTNLLLEAPLEPRAREMVETVRNCGEMLIVVINDILDFSKLESGGMELENEPFELRACVEDCLDLFAGRAGEKGLNLVYAMAEECPETVRGDATRVKQVLCNLIGNAVKFTSQGEVEVRVNVEGGRRPEAGDECVLKVSVRDTGIGIPAERQDRLFKSFSQVDSSTARKYGGTGLGLAIAKRLTELMGGMMSVRSAGGEGSTFSFTMKTRAEAPRAGVGAKAAAPSLGHLRALVVSESATSLAVWQEYLRQWGIACFGVNEAMQALRLLREGPAYQLLITDMQMPGMDGLELCRRIRESAIVAPRIIMMSAVTRADIRAVAMAQGVSAVLQKPVRPSTMLQAIEELLVGAAAPAKEAVAARSGDTPAKLGAELPLRVLVVDDNKVNQMVARRMLEHFGYEPDVATNGEEAVEAVLRKDYDAVFMDVQMPVMNGFEATRKIRSTVPLDRQPWIVALTANALEGDRESCLREGMDDYLPKPIRAAELESALRRVKAGGRKGN